MDSSPVLEARQVLDVVPLIMCAIRREMRSHRSADISVPQFRTLAFLNEHEGASLSDAAEFIGLTLPSMSKLVDGLVTRGLVTRQTHPGDRRRMTLTLTGAGQEFHQSARQATQDCLARRLALLSDSDRAAVMRAMEALCLVFMPSDEPVSPLSVSAEEG